MNGTMQRWLQGAILTLGLALACASVGCVTPEDPDTDADPEQVDEAAQQLEEVDAPPPPEDDEESTGAPSVDEGAVDDGEGGEPQPVPWIVFIGSAVPDDIDPIDPVSGKQASAPSGHSGK